MSGGLGTGGGWDGPTLADEDAARDMPRPLDRARLNEAFELLGTDLAERGHFVEIAVYGGSAIMLHFEWRRSTDDVDAVLREGYDERVLAASVDLVGRRLGLHAGWLNDAVGMFTPLVEAESLFAAAGTYPTGGRSGLRVFVATPPYLLALKLAALGASGRGDRDADDARHLAREVGIVTEAALAELYVSIMGEEPPPEARLRFATLLET